MGGVVPQKNTIFVTAIPVLDEKTKAAFLKISENITYLLLVFVEGGVNCGLPSRNNVIFKDINSIIKFDKLDFLAAARKHYYCDFCYFGWINYDSQDYPRQMDKYLLRDRIIIKGFFSSSGSLIDDSTFIVPSDILRDLPGGFTIQSLFEKRSELFQRISVCDIYSGYLNSNIKVNL
jgi:hypothetical protein